MKVIVAGSRNFIRFSDVLDAIELFREEDEWEITELVSGTARGVDMYGERWASKNNVPIKRFPADWKNHGRSAGIRRNRLMAEYADALVAVWDGSSRGTRHMIQTAYQKGLPTLVYVPTTQEPRVRVFKGKQNERSAAGR